MGNLQPILLFEVRIIECRPEILRPSDFDVNGMSFVSRHPPMFKRAYKRFDHSTLSFLGRQYA